MSERYRPEGHLLSKQARLAAQRAVLREHFGPYHVFVQRMGSVPVVYLIIGIIINLKAPVHLMLLTGVGALLYAFLFHIYAVSYFAARSKIGLDSFKPGTIGFLWSRIFIARAVFDHLVMMSALIWLGTTWFLASGIVLYALDFIITLSTWQTPSPAGGQVKKNTSDRSGRSS